MIYDSSTEKEFGIAYVYRIVLCYRVKNSCFIERDYRVEYEFCMVNVFRIFIGKGMVNDYWVISVFF